MKWKAFFVIFKGLSFKQIKTIFLKGESPTLREGFRSFYWDIMCCSKLAIWSFRTFFYPFILFFNVFNIFIIPWLIQPSQLEIKREVMRLQNLGFMIQALDVKNPFSGVACGMFQETVLLGWMPGICWDSSDFLG